jgi:hypothetical protein
LSVTAEIVPVLVPPVLLMATERPPPDRRFPFASLAVKVIPTLDPEATVAELTVATDCASDRGPGVTVTVGAMLVVGFPLMVAVTELAVPAIIPVS